MRKFTDWGPAVLVLTATLLALLVAPTMVRRVEFAQTSARVTLARQALGEDDILERIDQAVRRVAESVEPSVAHIDVRLSSRVHWASSSGSGWLFDTAGHIVTNAHVVRGADRIRAQLSDGRLYDAELVGADPFTDIAVLKLPTTEGLVPATRASGTHPRQGERVFAFGSPFGFKFSMSQGIISGLGREPEGAVAMSAGFTNFIQTDAAVNPGNSGGPLVNVRGEVVGMNVAIATGSDSQGTTEGQSAGISFAIPLPVIESVVTQLIETGTVRRGFLGITMGNSETERLRDAGFNGFGVQIDAVSVGGPAADAGLKDGDVITAIDGQVVTGIGVLRSLISSVKPGDGILLSVWRNGETWTTRAVLAQAGPDVVLSAGVRDELARFGLLVNGTDRRSGGDPPVFTRVVADSPAAQAGCQRGQRVVKVGGHDVATLDEFAAALSDQGFLIGREVEIEVTQQDADTGEIQQKSITLQISP
ncbi:MAG: trypsin-like peptidase domain-containing protein [Phycisphaerales bacterium]|nr:trypsin-like peptidase domain-containing protein [Phycisphaerales bacterium]